MPNSTHPPKTKILITTKLSLSKQQTSLAPAKLYLFGIANFVRTQIRLGWASRSTSGQRVSRPGFGGISRSVQREVAKCRPRSRFVRLVSDAFVAFAFGKTSQNSAVRCYIHPNVKSWCCANLIPSCHAPFSPFNFSTSPIFRSYQGLASLSALCSMHLSASIVELATLL